MSATAHVTARTKPDALASLIARLPDPQDRDWYAELVAYIQALPPQDELVKVAQLFGFLTLMGRELPEALAAEQTQLREFLGKAYGELQQEVKTNGRYHEQLNERLSKLPGEIAAGVKPEVIAKAMGESFRQQLIATGIEETKTFLAAATSDLKQAAKAVDAAVKPIAGRYGTIAADMETKVTTLTDATNQLRNAANAVSQFNSALWDEVRKLEWWILPLAALVLLLVGVFFGVYWEKQSNTSSFMELQGQIQQVQDSIKNLPAALAPSMPSKKPKKGS